MYQKIKVIALIWGVFMLGGCDQANDTADQTVRELTGSHMLQQEKLLKQKLDGIQSQQRQRMQQLEQQDGQ